MFQKLKLILVSFAIFSFLGIFLGNCASVQYAPKNEFPEVKTGKSLIYFYRESSFVGAAISYYVKYNGEKIGALQNGSYFFYELEPGEHNFVATTEVDEIVRITTEANKTYYIKGEVTMGVLAGRPKLYLVSEDVAKSQIRSLKLVSIN